MVSTQVEKKPSSEKNFEEGFFNLNQTYIHPSSIIGNNVKIGSNVKIGPNCTIVGDVYIDDNTKIFPNTTIGFPAQDVSVDRTLGTIKIGKNCTIREFVSINSSKKEDGLTRIGDDCYIMNYSHLAHDVILEENVKLINNVNLGGHTHVEKGCMLMASVAVHQFCRIGKFSCVTPFSGTRQDITPFSMFSGQPGRFAGLNVIALKRANFSSDSIDAIKTISKLYFQDKLPLAKIKELLNKEQWGYDLHAKEFFNFIETSDRGVSRKRFSYGNNE